MKPATEFLLEPTLAQEVEALKPFLMKCELTEIYTQTDKHTQKGCTFLMMVVLHQQNYI